VISTPDLLGPLLDCGNSFVLIQNGVGIEGALRRQLPAATIISGCAWIDATIVEKGRLLTQYGGVGIPSGGTFLLPDQAAGAPYLGSSPPPWWKVRGRVSEAPGRSPPERRD